MRSRAARLKRPDLMSDRRNPEDREYLSATPRAVPEGRVLVHNHVQRLRRRDRRAWVPHLAGAAVRQVGRMRLRLGAGAGRAFYRIAAKGDLR